MKKNNFSLKKILTYLICLSVIIFIVLTCYKSCNKLTFNNSFFYQKELQKDSLIAKSKLDSLLREYEYMIKDSLTLSYRDPNKNNDIKKESEKTLIKYKYIYLTNSKLDSINNSTNKVDSTTAKSITFSSNEFKADIDISNFEKDTPNVTLRNIIVPNNIEVYEYVEDLKNNYSKKTWKINNTNKLLKDTIQIESIYLNPIGLQNILKQQDTLCRSRIKQVIDNINEEQKKNTKKEKKKGILKTLKTTGFVVTLTTLGYIFYNIIKG